MEYKGVIIEESLLYMTILKELRLVSQEIEEVTERENTPWLSKWTLDTVEIPEEKIEEYAERLQML